MNARPFNPRMGRRRRTHEVPGWVLVLVGVLLVMATGWVENASPGAMAGLFHTVGLIAWVAVWVLAVLALIAAWLWFLVYCWRRMDGPR